MVIFHEIFMVLIWFALALASTHFATDGINPEKEIKAQLKYAKQIYNNFPAGRLRRIYTSECSLAPLRRSIHPADFYSAAARVSLITANEKSISRSNDIAAIPESQLKQSKILAGLPPRSLSLSHSALIKISPRFFRLFYGHSFAISRFSPRFFLAFFPSSQLFYVQQIALASATFAVARAREIYSVRVVFILLSFSLLCFAPASLPSPRPSGLGRR
jgi:hypothetical protein